MPATPYETMKLRMLNASHHAVAGLGRLLGHDHVSDCLADPRLRGLMAALLKHETGPTVPPVPGIDLAVYRRTLLARFANPAVRDTPARIVAAWMRCMTGLDEQGAPIVSRHPMAAALQERARLGGGDPAPMLGLTADFGTLANHPGLVVPLRRWLGLLHTEGAAATLAAAARGGLLSEHDGA